MSTHVCMLVSGLLLLAQQYMLCVLFVCTWMHS